MAHRFSQVSLFSLPIDSGAIASTRGSSRKNRLFAILARVGRSTLLVVVLGLALIGFLHVTRGTAVRHVRGIAPDGVAISVSESEFPAMATMATGAWLAAGNRVEVTQNGDETFPRLWDDLRSARQAITLQVYYGAPGRMADMLTEVLRERASAGVRVFVLYDAFGTVDIPPAHRDALRSAGVVVQPFRRVGGGAGRGDRRDVHRTRHGRSTAGRGNGR